MNLKIVKILIFYVVNIELLIFYVCIILNCLNISFINTKKKKKVINTHKGLKEFTRVPYGIAPCECDFSKKIGK